MKLLTKANRKALPKLYSSEHLPAGEAFAQVKFFNPTGAGTWYATEFDGHNIFFGMADIQEPELGYFNLTELSAFRGQMGLPIERDLHFEPTMLKDLYPEKFAD